MYAFSARIVVPAGATLAGFSDRMHVPTTAPGILEIHGFGDEAGNGWQVCAVDALYAGVLTGMQPEGGATNVFAASHTHYAPSLDAAKPALGNFSPSLASLYEDALRQAPRADVAPDCCELLIGTVDIPVYRRFDFPGTALNGLLTRHAGRYPNDAHPVDRNVYIFSFTRQGQAQFSIVYHACHPVTRHDCDAASPDYIGAIRQAVGARFGAQPCLFFLGCAGDVRPNLAEKRINWLPRSRLNWRFRPEPSVTDQERIDTQYRQAVENAQPVARLALGKGDFRLSRGTLPVHGLGEVAMPRLDVGEKISFSFLPFEVSHRYQLEVAAMPQPPLRFIVSCSDAVRGYLPHADQHRYGGYEVEGSRGPMGLERAISIESQDIWPSR